MPEEAGFRLAAVILAAGSSTRLGQPKQLLGVGGATLVARAADAALRAGASPVIVVVGADEPAVRSALGDRPLVIVRNEAWASGMASSLRLGIAAARQAQPPADAVLVAPCDQPALDAACLRRLVDAHRRTARIAAARYAGRLGVPALGFDIDTPGDLEAWRGRTAGRK